MGHSYNRIGMLGHLIDSLTAMMSSTSRFKVFVERYNKCTTCKLWDSETEKIWLEKAFMGRRTTPFSFPFLSLIYHMPIYPNFGYILQRNNAYMREHCMDRTFFFLLSFCFGVLQSKWGLEPKSTPDYFSIRVFAIPEQLRICSDWA